MNTQSHRCCNLYLMDQYLMHPQPSHRKQVLEQNDLLIMIPNQLVLACDRWSARTEQLPHQVHNMMYRCAFFW